MRTNQEGKFIVEIWSDVVCPYCYLGKRKFEAALDQFPGKDSIQVVWRSFQLNQGVHTDTTMDVYTYLSHTKGIPERTVRQMTDQITNRGKEVGINYDFDATRVNNTYRAHCLLHFAAQQGKQDETKEALLNAYFAEGMNVDDETVLLRICEKVGLDPMQFKAALDKDTFQSEVREDMELAHQFGISGVPFFVFDRKYAVSGAQETEVFLQTLNKAFSEWKVAHPGTLQNSGQGAACTPDEGCE